MIELSLDLVRVGATAQTKEDAIRQVTALLTEAGRTEAGYVDGMLARE